MIRRRRPSCCLLVVIRCAMLCTTAAMGFAPEITNKSCLLAVSSLSSLSFRKQFNKPQYLSSAHHHHHHAGSFFVHDQKFSALSMLRGGGSVVVAVPVSSIMKAVPLAVQTTTAYASVLFLVVSNLALLVAPNFMLETVCNNTKPTSSSSSSSSVATSDNAAAAAAAANNVASATFVRLIATAGLGVALSLYLAIIRESSSPLIAMGWGLVPRLILFWYLLLFENRMNSNSNSLLPSFGSLQENKRFFMVNTILTTWVTASLLLGLGKNPAMTARIFSTMSIIKCSLLILRPLSVGSKFVGFDVGRKGESVVTFFFACVGLWLQLWCV